MQVLNSIAPVFFFILLGALLFQSKFLSQEMILGTNKMVYWWALPCLFFLKTAKVPFAELKVQDLALTWFAATLVMILLLYGMCFLFRVNRGDIGSVVQASFRGNLAFVGLPVILYSLDLVPQHKALLAAQAVLALLPMVVAYNILGVMSLLSFKQDKSQGVLGPILKEVVRNPLILSCLVGVGASYGEVQLPTALLRVLESFSQIVLPLSLICVGGSVVQSKLKGSLKLALFSASNKTLLSPLVGYLVGRGLGLDPALIKIMMIYMATPTAALGYIMAQQFGGNAQMTANSLVISLATSCLSMSLIIAFF